MMQNAAAAGMGETQSHLMRELLHHRDGLTVVAMAGALHLSRNAVRQHLITLERDGLVARGETKATGGRPHQLYVLTDLGSERFPRQYSWFSELLLQSLKTQTGEEGASAALSGMGLAVGESLRQQLPDEPASPDQLAAIAAKLTDMGYDAVAQTQNGERVIEAHNCVFHRLSSKHPEVCQFDLALLSSASGCRVEQHSCMINDGASCRFCFKPDKG